MTVEKTVKNFIGPHCHIRNTSKAIIHGRQKFQKFIVKK